MADRTFAEPRGAASARDGGSRVRGPFARRGDHRAEAFVRAACERRHAWHERIEDGLVPDLRLSLLWNNGRSPEPPPVTIPT